ncbi:MAG TPA: hypothetical protein VML95_02060 [Longimicrobiales bacterium]|nr:hypothetical protein [Longimicrobiales bacterium]
MTGDVYGVEDLSDASPELVLVDSDAVEEWAHRRRRLWKSLVELHNGLVVLRQLVDYPTILLAGYRDLRSLLLSSLHDHAALIVHRLWEDQRSSGSLKQLRTFLMKSVRPEWEGAVRDACRRAAPSPEVEESVQRIKQQRHVDVAHIDAEAGSVPWVPLAELEEAARTLERFYNAIGLGTEAHLGLRGLDPLGASGEPSELVALLDAGVALGPWSRNYDEDPDAWMGFDRPRLDDDAIRVLNRARVASGMAAIPTDPPTA